MLIELIIYTTVALLFGVVVWWVWTQRQMALRQAEMNAELSELGRGLRGVAHDLNHYFELIATKIDGVRELSAPELHESLDEISRTTRGAANLVRTIRGEAVPVRRASAEGVVRLSVIMMRGCGVPIELRVNGKLPYEGDDSDALRAIQNVLSNAVREAARHEAAAVVVELSEGTLSVSNPVDPSTSFGDEVYDDGISGAGSTGLGLGVARQAAERVGWQVSHAFVDRTVVFTFGPKR